MLALLISFSCNPSKSGTAAAPEIENTLQSVSYLKDTVGMDPQDILRAFQNYNDAIAEIGYPDAGYKLWIIQEDTSDIRFMVEGLWPDQDKYTEIHEHDLYKAAAEQNMEVFTSGLVFVEYHRFEKVK